MGRDTRQWCPTARLGEQARMTPYRRTRIALIPPGSHMCHSGRLLGRENETSPDLRSSHTYIHIDPPIYTPPDTYRGPHCGAENSNI